MLTEGVILTQTPFAYMYSLEMFQEHFPVNTQSESNIPPFCCIHSRSQIFIHLGILKENLRRDQYSVLGTNKFLKTDAN